MRLEDYLCEMKSGDDIIVSALGRYGPRYIIEINCWVDDDTGEKYFSGEVYWHADCGLEIYRDEDEPLYNSNTAADVIRKCKEIQREDDITELDWEVYKTRDELIAENAKLVRNMNILNMALKEAARDVLVKRDLDPFEYAPLMPYELASAFMRNRADQLAYGYIKHAEEKYGQPENEE